MVAGAKLVASAIVDPSVFSVVGPTDCAKRTLALIGMLALRLNFFEVKVDEGVACLGLIDFLEICGRFPTRF